MTRRKAPRGLAQIAYEASERQLIKGTSMKGLSWQHCLYRRAWNAAAKAVAAEVRRRMSAQPRRRAKQRRGT